MSDEDCVKNLKKRFKGVETFLRRVAFNLGNSPSETEVKIISCIPIDVTDLQQKIMSLERQLEEAARKQQEQQGQQEQQKQEELPKQKSQHKPEDKLDSTFKSTSKTTTVNTALYELNFIRKPMPNNNDQEDEPRPQAESPRQKKSGVSFLLDPPNVENGWSDISSRRKLIEESFDASEQIKKFLKKSKRKLLRKRNKKTQLIYYAQTTAPTFNITKKSTSEDTPNDKDGGGITQSYLSDVLRKQYSPKIVDGPSDTSDFSTPICRDVHKNPCLYESEVCSCCNGKFHNIDQDMTSTSFNKDHSIPLYNDLLHSIPKFNINECIKSDSIYYDTNFYDIVPVKEVSPKVNKVKGNSKNTDKVSSKFKEEFYVNCWPENFRTKSRLKPLIVNYYHATRPTGIYQSARKNEHVTWPRQENINVMSKNDAFAINTLNQGTGMNSSKSCCVECGDVYYKKHYAKHRHREYYHHHRPRNRHHHYKEDVLRVKHRKPKPTTCKNTACSTVNINHSECQTAPPENVCLKVITEENKAETTLNQIKSILETVLTEVKTTTQNPKKDAMVQKEVSQNNMQGASSLMHSFTYSPYNINQGPYNLNPYAAACSQQIGSYLCCPGTFPPIRRMQNFPLFIQPTGRHVCSGCYRHSSNIKKSAHIEKAVAASTNTDTRPEIKHSKETEKLIREIYKSIALDIPTKDTSNSECYDIKPSLQMNIEKSDKADKAVYREISDGPKKNIKSEALMTPFIAYPFDSKSISAAITMHSQQVSTTDTDKEEEKNRNQLRNDTISTLMYKRDIQSTETEIGEDKPPTRCVNLEQRSRILTTSDDDSDTLSDDTESDDTLIMNETVKVQKKEKKGIFSKMFQNVKLFKTKDKKRETKLENEDEHSETSDSDDYQTIYSKNVTPKHVSGRTRYHTSKPHTKYRSHSHQKSYQETPRRSPYMEQEYKRHWNEDLTFHGEADYRRSSEDPFSRHTTRSSTPSHYRRNYEARSVVVERNGEKVTHYPKDSPDIDETRRHSVDKPTHVVLDATRGRAQYVWAPTTGVKNKGLSWLKKHKLGASQCGEQWKKFILES